MTPLCDHSHANSASSGERNDEDLIASRPAKSRGTHQPERRLRVRKRRRDRHARPEYPSAAVVGITFDSATGGPIDHPVILATGGDVDVEAERSPWAAQATCSARWYGLRVEELPRVGAIETTDSHGGDELGIEIGKVDPVPSVGCWRQRLPVRHAAAVPATDIP